MALRRGALPATIKVGQPPTRTQHGGKSLLPRRRTRAVGPRLGPSAARLRELLGFGGSNFHLTLEEYPGPRAAAGRRRAAPTELVSAAIDGGSAPRAEPASGGRGAGFLRGSPRDQQTRSRVGGAAGDHRRHEQDLPQKIAAAARGAPRTPGASIDWASTTGSGRRGGLAYLFAGQGSQYPGMGAGLALLIWPRARCVGPGGRPAARGARGCSGWSSRRRRSPTRSGRVRRQQLRRTQWAQPALAAAALAQLNLLAAAGVRPACVGGHSFGEVAALHAAGVFDAPTLLEVARRRGELMAAAARRPAR